MEHRSTRVLVESVVGALGIAMILFAVVAGDSWMATHTTERYCFTDEATLSRAHAARWIVGGIGALFVVFVRSFTGRRLGQRTPGELARATGPIVLAVVLAFVVTDVFLRVTKKKEVPAPLGFGHRPLDTLTTSWAGREIHYAVNKYGYRTQSAGDVHDPKAPSILFSGESIIFGVGLDYEETIPAVVGAKTGLQTVNLGVGGYANDLSFLRLKAEMPKFEHPVAVVTLVLLNWMQRNAGEDREHLVPGPDGTTVLAPPTIPEFLRSSPLFTVLRVATHFHSDGAVESARAVIADVDAYVRGKGAMPFFVFTSAGAPCLRPSIRERITEGASVNAIDVTIPPELYLPGDTNHPSPKGAVLFADAIAAALRSKGVY